MQIARRLFLHVNKDTVCVVRLQVKSEDVRKGIPIIVPKRDLGRSAQDLSFPVENQVHHRCLKSTNVWAKPGKS